MNEQIMLGRCQTMLIALLGRGASYTWWASPNKAFELQTPDQVWDTEPEKVYNYLMKHVQV